jgi:hypothetical protein
MRDADFTTTISKVCIEPVDIKLFTYLSTFGLVYVKESEIQFVQNHRSGRPAIDECECHHCFGASFHIYLTKLPKTPVVVDV